MIKLMVMVAIATILCGCASETSYQRTTAALTGCSEEDIQISDVQTSGSNAWKAICRNDARIYTCTKKACTEVK